MEWCLNDQISSFDAANRKICHANHLKVDSLLVILMTRAWAANSPSINSSTRCMFIDTVMHLSVMTSWHSYPQVGYNCCCIQGIKAVANPLPSWHEACKDLPRCYCNQEVCLFSALLFKTWKWWKQCAYLLLLQPMCVIQNCKAMSNLLNSTVWQLSSHPKAALVLQAYAFTICISL